MTTTVWLVRHAKVASHLGDQPLTADALGPVDDTAALIEKARHPSDTITFHSTRTKRSQQTADALRNRIKPGAGDALQTWGLRNPDLYLLGSRVEMVSRADAFAAQIEGLPASEADVLAHPFFKGFLTAPDRIEYWLTHKDPPGESAADVARRLRDFARSFATYRAENHHAICVTHSPVLRAVLVYWLGIIDPGEPDWVEAIQLRVTAKHVKARFRNDTITMPIA